MIDIDDIFDVERERYKIIEKLRIGEEPTTYKIYDTIDDNDNKLYVLKKHSIKNISTDEVLKILIEVNTISSLKNENILNFCNTFHNDDTFTIIADFCNQNLATYLKINIMNFDVLLNFMNQLVNALKYLHIDRDFTHKNIKPENIFVCDKGIIKLGDFGITRFLNLNTHSLSYVSPEILKGEEYNNKTDIWSLGIILYQICTKHLPYIQQIKDSDLTVKNINNQYKNFNALLKGMLEKNQILRYNILQVERYLNSIQKQTKFKQISVNLEYLFENAHEEIIINFLVLPNNNLVSCSNDKSLKFWNIEDDFKCLKHIPNAHESSVRCLKQLSKNILASGSEDRSIKFWDIYNYECLRHITDAHMYSVYCFELLPNNILVSGSLDDSIKFWDINNGKCIRELINDNDDSVICLQALPNNLLATGSNHGVLKVLNIDSAESIFNITNAHFDSIRCFQLYQNNILISASQDLSIKFWDIYTYQCIKNIQLAHDYTILSLQLLTDNVLASGSLSKCIKLWNIDNDVQCIENIKDAHDSSITCLHLLPNNRFVSGSIDKNIKIWKYKIHF